VPHEIDGRRQYRLTSKKLWQRANVILCKV
jgi:hypothetical protein